MINPAAGIRIKGGVVKTIARHALRALATGYGPYVVLTIGFAAAMTILRSAVGEITGGYVTVLAQPLVLPIIVMTILGGMFAALSSSISLTRERELGTLETLFFGPISPGEYLMGQYLAHLFAFVGIMAVFLFGIYVWSLLTQLVFAPVLLWIGMVSIAASSGFIGLGLLAGAAMRTTRGALLSLAGFAFVILVLQIGDTTLGNIVSSGSIGSLVTLRDSISAVNHIVTWTSPIVYLLDGEEAALRQDWIQCVGYSLGVVAYGLAALVIAQALLQKQGVMR